MTLSALEAALARQLDSKCEDPNHLDHGERGCIACLAIYVWNLSDNQRWLPRVGQAPGPVRSESEWGGQ